MKLQDNLGTVVGGIIEDKLVKEVKKKRSLYNSLKEGRKKGVRIIAEIKPSSPSKGDLKSIDIGNIANIAKEIEDGGASAISVLVEPREFQGSMDFLKEIRRATDLPILAKGFFFTPFHLSECAVFGADAYLLMIRVLETLKVNKEQFVKFGQNLDLEPFFEANSLEEIRAVPDLERRIIEINNRNIYGDLEINLDNITLGKKLSGEDILVSASGLFTPQDLEKLFYLSNNSLDAVLIGTSIMRSDNMSEKVREFVDKGREVVK
jgi:indole-3-glycerol phosphate synthase